jgi:hypothetical protein
MFGDNQSVVTSSTIPHSFLNKRHNALAYHRVREAIAAGILNFMHVSGKTNVSDIFTKFLPWADFWPLVQPLLFWKGDTIIKTNPTLPISAIVALLKAESEIGLRGVTRDTVDPVVSRQAMTLRWLPRRMSPRPDSIHLSHVTQCSMTAVEAYGTIEIQSGTGLEACGTHEGLTAIHSSEALTASHFTEVMTASHYEEVKTRWDTDLSNINEVLSKKGLSLINHLNSKKTVENILYDNIWSQAKCGVALSKYWCYLCKESFKERAVGTNLSEYSNPILDNICLLQKPVYILHEGVQDEKASQDTSEKTGKQSNLE